MIMYRNINDVEIAVNINTAREISFKENFISEKNISLNSEQIDILKAISKENFSPLYLMWEIIDKCNFSCPFCYIVGHSNNKLVRFEKTKPYIQEIIDNGLLYCLLTGGEATYHKDFIDIYTFLKKNGVFVEVYTNGYNISDKLLSIFREYPPYMVEISIYGMSDVVFQKATNTTLKAKDVLNNILRLKNNGILVKCKTALNKCTLTEFEDIRKWCSDNDIMHYHSSELTMGYDGHDTDNWAIDFNTAIKYDAENEFNFRKKYGPKPPSSQRKCFSCSVGTHGLYIDSKFNMMPCSSFHTKSASHNIFEKGISNSIADMLEYIDRVYHKPIKGCVGCSASHLCKMCPALAAEVYDDKKNVVEFQTNDVYCDRTRRHAAAVDDAVSKYIP